MHKKKIICAALSAVMLAGSFTALADEEINIIYNGNAIETYAPPVIENDRVLVGARGVFEAMGCEIEWDETAKKVTVRNDRQQLSLTMESTTMVIQGVSETLSIDSAKRIEMDVPAKIIKDRTYIPLRAVAEAMDKDVNWDDSTYTVTISTPASPLPAPPKPEVTTFADKLKEQMPSDENYMVSPLSLKIALAMYANGADKDIQEEMLKAMNIENLDEFNDYIKKFIEEYNKKEPSEPQQDITDDYGAEFKLSNSIWINKDNPDIGKNAEFTDEFSEIIKNYYYGASEKVGDKDAVERINKWTSDATNGKIPTIIDNPDFAAALVNAIYMKARWINQFSEYATEKDIFTDRSGKENEVDFMKQTDHFNYYDDGKTKMLRLPYEGGLSMYIVLGDANESSLKYYIENSEMKKVEVSIPKWKTESTFANMKDIVKKMGMETALDTANASMLKNSLNPVYVSDIIQKTYIDVDEKGTEAAAVTAIIAVGCAAMPQPEEIKEFKADKPFTYFICDSNNEILFMGEYAFTQ